MTQTKDLIKKMADFFTSEEYYEKGEDARLELSPDDVRCMNELIKRMSNLDKIRAEIEKEVWNDVITSFDGTDEIRIPRLDPDDVFEIIDKYRQKVRNE